MQVATAECGLHRECLRPDPQFGELRQHPTTSTNAVAIGLGDFSPLANGRVYGCFWAGARIRQTNNCNKLAGQRIRAPPLTLDVQCSFPVKML